jgi:hypothetical protein
MIWDDMLSSGRKLTGRGGSDSHHGVPDSPDKATKNSYQATGKKPMVEFTDTPATIGRTYYRVAVEGPVTAYPQFPGSMALSGNMVGLSNPIYFNFDPNF